MKTLYFAGALLLLVIARPAEAQLFDPYPPEEEEEQPLFDPEVWRPVEEEAQEPAMPSTAGPAGDPSPLSPFGPPEEAFNWGPAQPVRELLFDPPASTLERGAPFEGPSRESLFDLEN
jgi:hypothetical protein